MTKVAIAEFETKVRTAEELREFVMWEPQTDFVARVRESGMAVREKEVFEDIQSPQPLSTQEAVEDTSTHGFDDDTQVWSIRFVGKKLVYCPEEKLQLSIKDRAEAFLYPFHSISEFERRSMFEGAWTTGWDKALPNTEHMGYFQPGRRSGKQFISDYYSQPYPESPAYFREIQSKTRASDLHADIDTKIGAKYEEISDAADKLSRAINSNVQTTLQNLIATAFMVPTMYLGNRPSRYELAWSTTPAPNTYFTSNPAHARYLATCLPSRSQFSEMYNIDEIEALGLEHNS